MNSDETVYMQSMQDEKSASPFIDREILYVNDSNNASYNGSIQFDTTVLANSGRWLDYSEGVLEVPISLTYSPDTNGIEDEMNSYIYGLKNGYHHLIDSLQVEWNNRSVVQVQSYTNFYVSYKLMSELSEDDVAKWGSHIGFHPDSAASFAYNGAASINGLGISNNRPYDQAARTYTPAQPLERINDGFAKRLESLTAHPVQGYGGLLLMDSAAELNSVAKNYFQNNANGGGDAAGTTYTHYIIATIRLKDVSDFFSKLPLTRGGQLRINVNYNSCRLTLTNAAGPTQTLTSVTKLSGRTTPFMVSSAGPNQPAAAYAALANVMTVEFNVKSTSNPLNANSPLLSSARLYVPAYKMNPQMEVQYLESFPVKTIEYDDLYMFEVDVAAGGNFNAILTNGIVSPEKLVVMPYVAAASNVNVVPWESPFDTAPATTTPCALLRDFNVLISGKAVFQQNINYTWELFQAEVSKSGVGGGQETGLCSGLIGRREFENGYAYHVVDLSRRLPSEDVVPKSVQILGVNPTGLALKLICFITYKRSLSIELSSGNPV